MPTDAVPTAPVRRSWPYLAAPLGAYLMVMLPICCLQVFLIFQRCPLWMHLSSAAVLAISLVGLLRGYVRRLVITPEGASFRGVFSRIDMAWKDVRRVGIYIPGGGVGSTEYFYITTRDHEPDGKWDIGAHTIQIQNQPGLSEAAGRFRARSV